MRFRLLAIVFTMAFVAQTAIAKAPAPAGGNLPGPHMLFYTMPLGKLLDQAKAIARLTAGGGIASMIDGKIQEQLGEKGLKGLDLKRSMGGYLFFPEDYPTTPEEWKTAYGVVGLPVTSNDEFRDLLGRATSENPVTLIPVKGDEGLFRVEIRGGIEEIPVMARFLDGWVYVGINVKNEAMSPARLIRPDTFVDKNDTALVTVKAFSDRMENWTKAMDKQFEAMSEQFKQVGGDVATSWAGVFEAYIKWGRSMNSRIVSESTESGYRLRFEEKIGELMFDMYITPKKGSRMASELAERKESTNQFAGLIPRNAAASLTLQFPMMNSEFREFLQKLIDQGEKNLNQVPAENRPLAEETLKGLSRTIKGDSIDFVATVYPSAKDQYTFLTAITFDDAGKLEKPVQTAVASAPKKAQDSFKFNVAKANGVNLHEVVPPEAGEPEWFKGVVKTMGTRKLTLALGPKGIYGTMSADAKGTITQALAAKPGPAHPFEIQVNPKQLAGLVTSLDENAGNMVTPLFGNEDRSISVVYLSVSGGDSLTYRFAVNLKFLSRPFSMLGGLAR